MREEGRKEEYRGEVIRKRKGRERKDRITEEGDGKKQGKEGGKRKSKERR